MIIFHLQATKTTDPNRLSNAMTTFLQTNPKNLKQQKRSPPLPQFRILTASKSFDSKCSAINPTDRFHMSPEAMKLFRTLQQSPLPTRSEVKIGFAIMHKRAKILT